MKIQTIVLLTTAALGLTACTGEEFESWDPEDNINSVSQAGSPGDTNGLASWIVKGVADTTSSLPNIHTELYSELVNAPLSNVGPNVKQAICWAWKDEGTFYGDGPNISMFRSIVKCALANAPDINLSCQSPNMPYTNYTLTFSSSSPTVGLGLAPQWGTGTCDTVCQRKISACVIARADYIAGNLVPIDIRGMGLAAQSGFPRIEGAYWGNIFQATPAINGCYAPASENLTWDMPNDILGASPIPLFNRACYGFSVFGMPNTRGCISTDPYSNVDSNYLTNFATGNQVQSCASTCATYSNGIYGSCGGFGSVATVYRQ